MWELFRQAGWVAWPLGLCSVLAVGIMLERALILAGLRRQEAAAFDALRREESVTTAMSGQNGDREAPVRQILTDLQPLLRGRVGEETLLQAAEVALGRQRLRLRRNLSILATIGSTAPFIGLFGTVLGVMTAFRGMSSSGLSGETMAAGIAEALSATALGLVVAIPAVFAYNFYVGRVQAQTLEIQAHVLELIPRLREGK